MFLFSGCGNDSSFKTESPKEKVEQSKPELPKELTTEEKAAKEVEKKVAEEKRIAEQQAAEEKKAQEEARRQAERQAEEERRTSLLENGVQLNYTIEKLAEHKYKVIGTTNLPNGTELSIDLDNYWIFRREVMGIPDEENYDMNPLEFRTINDSTFRGKRNERLITALLRPYLAMIKNLFPADTNCQLYPL